MEQERLIKAVNTPQFEIEMYQDGYGRYRIRYKYLGKVSYSEYITDFGTASFMFDVKLKELEGH